MHNIFFQLMVGMPRVFQAFFLTLGFFRFDGDSQPSHEPPAIGNPFYVKGYNSFMAVVVSLRDFVDEMDTLSDEQHAYLNKVTGELITITNDDVAVVESGDDWSDDPEWQQEVYKNTEEVLSSEDYIKLPDKFEIHEYEIMERFCLSISDEKISDVLLRKIRGSGAFRRFKDTIYRYGIEKDWFKFRDEAYKEIAISWLENKGFAYADDMNK